MDNTTDLKNNMDRVKEAKSTELVNVDDHHDPIPHRVEQNLHHRHRQDDHIKPVPLEHSEFPKVITNLSNRSPVGSETIPTDFYFNFHTFVREKSLHPEEFKEEVCFTTNQLSDNAVTSNISNKLVEDVKDIYQDLMRTKVDALQWLELWHQGKSIDWWHPLFNAMYVLLKLYQTIFGCATHPMASPALQTLLEKYAMAPNLWQNCVHDFMEGVKSSNPGQGTLTDIECYLRDTKSVIASLQQRAGHLNQYWESYQAGLDHYLDCLSQIREGRTDWNHPEVFSGEPPPDLTSMFNIHSPDNMKKAESGNFDYHSVKSAASSKSVADTNKCPEIAAAALTGWTVFGQGVADTFDCYS